MSGQTGALEVEQWIGHAITAVGMLIGLAGIYAKIGSRLTAIEVALNIRDSQDAREARSMRIQAEIRRYCRDECPNRETTGVRSMGRMDQAGHGI